MQSTTNTIDTIGIAGAGLLGRLLAWRLCLAGFNVDLFDSGKIFSAAKNSAAAFTAAGMIAPLSEAVVSDANVYRMGQFALKRWPEWIGQLPASETLFFNNGSLLVAHPQDQSELDQFASELGFVIPECKSWKKISQEEIQQLEPDLHLHFYQGLFLEEEGHIHNREFLHQLTLQLQSLGCCFYEDTTVEVSANQIEWKGGKQEYSLVIDCRGMGAKQHWQGLRGVRGETLHVETTEIQLRRPVRLMHPRYQLYIVPKPQHRFIIGATQIESEDRSPMSLQSSLELGSALYTLAPAFSEARIIETDTNLRPAFADNLPKIKIQPGLIQANGLFRHGYLLAPAVVESVMANIQQTETTEFCSLLIEAP
jgi:glycine oxidase